MLSEDHMLVCFGTIIVIGYGYSLDMPQALEVPLRESPYNFSSLQFNLLYFAAFFPIVLTDIPIGILLDQYPIRKTVIIIAFTSLIAQLFTSLLFLYRPFGQNYKYLTYFMRMFFGIAGESAFTIQGMIITTYAAQSFQLLIGIGLCVPFVSDSINLFLTPLIFTATNQISLPWFIGTFIDFVSFVFSLIIAGILTRKHNRSEQQKRQKRALQQQTFFQGQLIPQQPRQQPQQTQEQQFKCNYLSDLPRLFWIVSLAIFFSELAIGGIFSNLNDLVVKRFAINYVATGYLLIIPFFVGAIMSIIIGKIVIEWPRSRRYFIAITPLVYSTGILAIVILPNNNMPADINAWDYVVIVLFFLTISASFAVLYTVLCSAISLLSDSKRLGTAWGVLGTAIGLGESVGPIINVFVLDIGRTLRQSYLLLCVVYFVISLVSILFGFTIFYADNEALDQSLTEYQIKETQIKADKKLKATVQD